MATCFGEVGIAMTLQAITLNANNMVRQGATNQLAVGRGIGAGMAVLTDVAVARSCGAVMDHILDIRVTMAVVTVITLDSGVARSRQHCAMGIGCMSGERRIDT